METDVHYYPSWLRSSVDNQALCGRRRGMELDIRQTVRWREVTCPRCLEHKKTCGACAEYPIPVGLIRCMACTLTGWRIMMQKHEAGLLETIVIDTGAIWKGEVNA